MYNFNVNKSKQVLLVVGILITSGYLTISNELKSQKIKTILKQRSAVLYDNKLGALLFLEGLLNQAHFSSIQIRVYKKQRFWIGTIIKRLKKEQFVLTHVDGLSNNNVTRKISFSAHPEFEGIVGKCYDEGVIKYEEDFSQVAEQYELSSFQKSQYLGVKFWLCAPIINYKGDIVSVLSFESIHQIAIPPGVESEAAVYIGSYCTNLYRNFPELFR